MLNSRGSRWHFNVHRKKAHHASELALPALRSLPGALLCSIGSFSHVLSCLLCSLLDPLHGILTLQQMSCQASSISLTAGHSRCSPQHSSRRFEMQPIVHFFGLCLTVLSAVFLNPSPWQINPATYMLSDRLWAMQAAVHCSASRLHHFRVVYFAFSLQHKHCLAR